MIGAPVRRQQVGFASERRISLRRACALLSTSRSALRYQSRMATKDAPLVATMKEFAAKSPRYGYRRIQVFMERRGTP